MRAKEIELIKLKLDTLYNDMEFIIGDSFRFFKGEFYFNTTPYSDSTLVSMHNIILNNGIFEFDYTKRIKRSHHKMNLSDSVMALYMANFIAHVNSMDKQYELSGSNDSFEFSYNKENGIQLSIEKASQNKRIVIFFNIKRDSFLVVVYPEPLKRYKLKECRLEGDIIHLQAEGKNLWDDNDTDVNISYDWHICLQPDILELFKYLLSTGMQLVGNSCFVNKSR